MHMADALISPTVGGAMLAVSATVAAYSMKKINLERDEQKIPLMGVMGAFIFAAQMVNFSIPATGSSGHLGGGILLASLLGPYGGFLTMASVLLIQSLFFADGGLLAYGCNVFNLGFFTCFIAYPLLFRPIIQGKITAGRITAASLLAAVIGLQLGSLAVVMQTVLSGKTELSFATFLLLMQPIHLAIGIVEGLVTGAVISFLWNARPELLGASSYRAGTLSLRKVLVIVLAAALVTAGGLSWFASSDPDGLEWSIEKTAGTAELDVPEGIHSALVALQSKIAIFPDYDFKKEEGQTSSDSHGSGTSVAGIIGGFMTLVLAAFIGWGSGMLKKNKGKIQGL